MQLNGTEIEGQPGQGVESIKVDLAHVGAKPGYSVMQHHFTAAVFVPYDLNTGKAVVLMVNGNSGPTITNAADQIIPFIQRQHIGRRSIKWSNVRWLYRDSDGDWDEIVVTEWHGTNTATVGFKVLGDRSIDAMFNAVRECGFELNSHDRAHLHNAIRHAETPRTLP